MKIKDITKCAVLIALALALAWAERLIPYELIVPLPGIKPGFANIVTLFALIYLGRKPALLVLVLRCLLAAFMFGTGVSFAFSICGGVLSFLVMSLLLYLSPRFSVFGISVAGAAAHCMGQIAVAALIMGSGAVVSYLPVMLFASIPCGLFTALIGAFLFPRLSKTARA